jgi:CheY-like chemotaxis protein
MKRLVLYIEDAEVNIRLVERILKLRPQVELAAATTGEAGLVCAADNSPSLVLLDWRLPDIDGGEVLRRLKASHQTAAIPVVVFSGDSGQEKVEEILRLGAAQFLPKPFDIHQLLTIVDRFCG